MAGRMVVRPRSCVSWPGGAHAGWVRPTGGPCFGGTKRRLPRCCGDARHACCASAGLAGARRAMSESGFLRQ
eukprot:7663721-Karenia_brevis.AAC.1